MDIRNQRKKLEKALTRSSIPNAHHHVLGQIFTENFFEDFDRLSLEQQKIKVTSLKKEWELYNRQYQKNCGKHAGAPIRNSDIAIESIIEEVAKIKTTAAYKKRKRSNETDSTAYRMLVESLLSSKEMEKLFIKEKWLSSYEFAREDEIRRIAKNFQQAAQRYKKSKAK